MRLKCTGLLRGFTLQSKLLPETVKTTVWKIVSHQFNNFFSLNSEVVTTPTQSLHKTAFFLPVVEEEQVLHHQPRDQGQQMNVRVSLQWNIMHLSLPQALTEASYPSLKTSHCSKIIFNIQHLLSRLIFPIVWTAQYSLQTRSANGDTSMFSPHSSYVNSQETNREQSLRSWILFVHCNKIAVQIVIIWQEKDSMGKFIDSTGISSEILFDTQGKELPPQTEAFLSLLDDFL